MNSNVAVGAIALAVEADVYGLLRLMRCQSARVHSIDDVVAEIARPHGKKGIVTRRVTRRLVLQLYEDQTGRIGNDMGRYAIQVLVVSGMDRRYGNNGKGPHDQSHNPKSSMFHRCTSKFWIGFPNAPHGDRTRNPISTDPVTRQKLYKNFSIQSRHETELRSSAIRASKRRELVAFRGHNAPPPRTRRGGGASPHVEYCANCWVPARARWSVLMLTTATMPSSTLAWARSSAGRMSPGSSTYSA